MRWLLFSLLLSFLMHQATCQVGGRGTYGFLNLPNSARVSALGGKLISIDDDDLNLVFNNPALLNREMHHHIVLNYVDYLTDINFGYFSYACSPTYKSNYAFGLHYVHYGDFIAADHLGKITGDFTAAEYAFMFSYSRQIDSSLRVGVNLKPVYSALEKYRSFGVTLDAGISYSSTDRLFNASLVLKNIGSQIVPYRKGNFEPMPFEIQAGVSQKLRHAPFRFILLLQHLQRYNLRYEDTDGAEEIDPLTGEPVRENKLEVFSDNMLRHAVFGIEIIPVDALMIRIGYNYQRRKELQIEQKLGGVGFSWGFGLRISRFHISYGRASYHLAGATNHFSLSTNLGSFFTNL